MRTRWSVGECDDALAAGTFEAFGDIVPVEE
jgi:hypothetical protein